MTTETPEIVKLCQMRHVSDSPLTFESVGVAASMGKKAKMAFGGSVACQALQAAFQSLIMPPPGERRWAVYSVQGNFLGPTLNDRPVQYRIMTLRETRSFATRLVIGSQKIGNDDSSPSPSSSSSFSSSTTKRRDNVVQTVDFIKRVEASNKFPSSNIPYAYSATPSQDYPAAEDVKHTWMAEVDAKIIAGELSPKYRDSLRNHFDLGLRILDLKSAPGGTMGETYAGTIKDITVTQENVAPPDRREADYFKSKIPIEEIVRYNNDVERKRDPTILPLDRYAMNACLVAWWLDSFLSFIPLVYHHKYFDDVAAASTLDYSLRFHNDDLDIDNWHTRELRSYSADRERTFSESMVWDKRGRLVCSETQQCILRAKPNANQTAKL